MKTIIFCTMVFVLLFFVNVNYCEEFSPPAVHVVKQGECLSSIAHRYYGSYNCWVGLAKLNNLSDPYLIMPGQRLIIGGMFSKRDGVRVAQKIVWKEMVMVFEKQHHRRYAVHVASRKWALKPLQLIVTDIFTVKITALLKEVQTRLEWQDLCEIYQAICDEARTADDILTLTALIKHESSYRNVAGSHGEIGPMQIKPGTALFVLQGFLGPDIPMEEVTETLWDIRVNVHAGWQHFKKCLNHNNGSVQLALQMYNNGSGRIEYAEDVLARRAVLLCKYNNVVRFELLSAVNKGI